MEINVRLTHPDERWQGARLVDALRTIRNHGFRTLSPVIRSGPDGCFFVATLAYVGGDEEERGGAEALLRETLAAE
jgi:hypothetical protein